MEWKNKKENEKTKKAKLIIGKPALVFCFNEFQRSFLIFFRFYHYSIAKPSEIGFRLFGSKKVLEFIILITRGD